MAVRKVSEFPVVEAVGVHVFGRKDNKNVQTVLDITQNVLGRSTTSIPSQAAVAEVIEDLKSSSIGTKIKLGRNINIGDDIVANEDSSISDALQNIASSFGRTTTIKSNNNSIKVTSNSSYTNIEVNLENLIDTNINNTLFLTSDGKLRSENKWNKWNN